MPPSHFEPSIGDTMKKLCAFFILLLSGCTTLKVQPVTPESIEMFRPYTADRVIEKSVGEQLIGYSLLLKAQTYPGFEAVEDFQPPAFAFAQNLPVIQQGSEWIAIARLTEGGYLCKNKKEEYKAIITTGFGQTVKSDWEVCLIVNAASEPYGTAVCSIHEPRASIWPRETTNFLKPKQMIEFDNKARREARVIYAGKTRDSIRFIYQETALRDLEFTFDLAESNTVAVKDIAFEVIEATNTSIKYKILTKPEELKTKIERQAKENGTSSQF